MKILFLLLIILLTTLQSYAQWTEFVWDTITFEEPYEYIVVDTSSQNIWQIGEPDKILFDSAYSINNAIVTDTLNCYPLNNYSYFDLYIGSFNINGYPDNIFIEFKHKFATDTLKDGGFITVSYDNGNTWMNIIEDTIYWDSNPKWENGNLYSTNDTLFNGEYGFSGNSNEWISTWFTWHNIPCNVKSTMDLNGDTMIVRFNFVSDNIETNKEGWMIDNIKLYSVDLGGGINDSKVLDFKISPNPFNETAIIELDNYREVELSVFDIKGQLVRKSKYFNSQSIILNRDNLKSGIYFMKIRTDENLLGVKKIIIK